MKTCSVCGRQVEETVTCLYQRRGLETCPECCEKCYRSEPFACRDHNQRVKEAVTPPVRGRKAVTEWAKTLDLPEDQVIPCLTAYAVTRYNLKSLENRRRRRNPDSLWERLKKVVALARWNADLKADPWNEIDRIRTFASWWKNKPKEGEAL